MEDESNPQENQADEEKQRERAANEVDCATIGLPSPSLLKDEAVTARD
jgi:hypothetical protein